MVVGQSNQSRQLQVEQIDRILQSATFRSSEALRRLLKFLAERTSSGQADQLKEYSIGVDCMGKSPAYDPRVDPSVRILALRLRQKLVEYYAAEGKEDTVLVALPKGQFMLTFDVASAVPREAITISPKKQQPALLLFLLGAALVLSLAWGAFTTFELSAERRNRATLESIWTPDLSQVWREFLGGKRPLVVAIADQPFAQFQGFGAYGSRSLVRWEDFVKSPEVAAIRKSLHDPQMLRSSYYAPIGDVSASFLLGRSLGSHVSTVSMLRSSNLSWQQFADSNVVYIGGPPFFEDQLNGVSDQLDFRFTTGGIENRRPAPGEEPFLFDHPSEVSADGEVHALITHLPGPLGTGDVMTFMSGRAPGRIAAVQWFTDAVYVKALLRKLRKPAGELSRYYQVLLRVRYKDGVPIEISYVAHHDVRTPASSTKLDRASPARQ